MTRKTLTTLATAAAMALTSPAFAQQQLNLPEKGCVVVSMNTVPDAVKDKDQITHIVEQILYHADPNLELDTQGQIDAVLARETGKLNNAEINLLARISQNKSKLDSANGFPVLRKPAELIYGSTILKDEKELQTRLAQNNKYFLGYCLDDLDVGYEAGRFSPRRLGEAIRDPQTGRFYVVKQQPGPR